MKISKEDFLKKTEEWGWDKCLRAFLMLRPEFLNKLGDDFVHQYETFLDRINANLPKIAEILADPANVRVPEKAHYQWLIGGTISRNIKAEYAERFATYLARLAPEIASMCVHDAFERDETLKGIAPLEALLLEGGGK